MACTWTLINDLIYERWAHTCFRRFGPKVNDYRNDQGWFDLASISQDLKPLMYMLNSIILNNKDDDLVQSANSSGTYSVVFGYLSLQNIMEKLVWAKVWTPGLIPKINIFLWLMLQEKILTLDNLIRRGQYILNWCILCKDNLESVDHMFIHCPYSSEV